MSELLKKLEEKIRKNEQKKPKPEKTTRRRPIVELADVIVTRPRPIATLVYDLMLRKQSYSFERALPKKEKIDYVT